MPDAMRGDRLAAFLASAGGWGAGLCLAGIVCAGVLQIFFRYVLNTPLRWPEELSRLLLVWLTYLGALVLSESGHHISVSFLYDRLSPLSRRAADLLATLMGVGFFGALVVGGLGLVGSMRGIRLPALQLPLNVLFGLIPILGVFQVYVHLVAAIRLLRGATGASTGDR